MPISNFIWNVSMWDFLLHAVKMFYYHWLMKKLLQTMAGQNRATPEN